MGGAASSTSRSAGRLSEAEFGALIQDARDRHNLSDIIARHTTLKKSGKELVGLCPFHTERTPSFEVNDNKGTYHCWGCGVGGDAITFLRSREGMSFREAIETLTGDVFPVISPEERAKRKEAEARDMAERVELGRSIWSRTIPPAGTPAEVYARSRGILIGLPPTVRFVMTPRWRNAETGEVGREHPAMACALQNVTGKIVGVQCIFLQDGGRRKYERTRDDGSKAKAKLSFGVLIGSALRLGPVARHIITCEGPEDGLSLLQDMPDKSVWASCGTANLSRLEYPSGVRSVCLAGDNGEAGRLAVDQARDSVQLQGLIASSAFPPSQFKDWNDKTRGIAQ